MFTGVGHNLWLCPTRERWMALRRTPLLLTTIAMAVLLVFVYGCQSDRQGG